MATNSEILRLFRALEIPQSADRQVYSQCYRKLCLKLHSDKTRNKLFKICGFDIKDITRINRKIIENYEIFSRPNLYSESTSNSSSNDFTRDTQEADFDDESDDQEEAQPESNNETQPTRN